MYDNDVLQSQEKSAGKPPIIFIFQTVLVTSALVFAVLAID